MKGLYQIKIVTYKEYLFSDKPNNDYKFDDFINDVLGELQDSGNYILDVLPFKDSTHVNTDILIKYNKIIS